MWQIFLALIKYAPRLPVYLWRLMLRDEQGRVILATIGSLLVGGCIITGMILAQTLRN